MTRGRRAALITGGVLLVPRILLALLAAPDPVAQLLLTLLFAAGVFVIGGALVRLWLHRHSRVLPVALVGIGLVVVAGLVIQARPPGRGDGVPFSGGLLAPAPAALEQLLYLAVGGVSQLGLVLVVGAIGAAVTRWAARRAAR